MSAAGGEPAACEHSSIRRTRLAPVKEECDEHGAHDAGALATLSQKTTKRASDSAQGVGGRRNLRVDLARPRDMMALGAALYKAVVRGAGSRTDSRIRWMPEPRVEGRAVWGVVRLQARPSLTAADRPMSVLLSASGGKLRVQTPDRRNLFLERVAEHFAATVLPGRDDMFRITVVGFAYAKGIVVAVRDGSMRDKWLRSLATAGVCVGGPADVPRAHRGSCMRGSSDWPAQGIVALQAVADSPNGGRGKCYVRLVAHGGKLRVQTLQKPAQVVLDGVAQHFDATAVLGRENMLRITAVGSETQGADAFDEGIVVVVRNCSMRDKWLEALATAGVRVGVTGEGNAPPK